MDRDADTGRTSGRAFTWAEADCSHLGDLPNLLAAELGVMTVRLERAIRSIDGVGRVHVNRWGDGSAHLHLWFYARPHGRLQLRGSFLSMWNDILPPVDEATWKENLALIAAWLAEFGGRALAEVPRIDWQAPSTLEASQAAHATGAVESPALGAAGAVFGTPTTPATSAATAAAGAMVPALPALGAVGMSQQGGIGVRPPEPGAWRRPRRCAAPGRSRPGSARRAPRSSAPWPPGRARRPGRPSRTGPGDAGRQPCRRP